MYTPVFLCVSERYFPNDPIAARTSSMSASVWSALIWNLGAWGALYAIGPELYPTSLRGTNMDMI